MPKVKVPLTTPVYKNIDGTMADDENYFLINGYSDEKGSTYSVPGYSEILDLSSITGIGIRCRGLYYWRFSQKGSPDVLIAVIDKTVIRIDYNKSLDAYSIINLGDYDGAITTPYASFATDGTNLFVALGSKIYYSVGTVGDIIEIADGDAPANVTHIAYLDGYILANNTDNKVWYSDVNNSLSWNALNFFSAAGNPDPVTALYVWNREIYLFGPTSIEIWQNDGVTPFSRINNGYIETGTIAPYSIAQTERGFFFLGDNRRFMEFDGRSIKQLSTNYDEEIEKLSEVSDCKAHMIKISGRQLIIFQFPTANRSFGYDLVKEEWFELGHYTGIGEQYNIWDVAAHAYIPTWGKHIIGGYSDAKLHVLSNQETTNNGTDIRVRRVSGHISYGTNSYKQCNGLTLRLKRGHTTELTEPKMSFRWNDDNLGWSNEVEVGLGKVGETEIVRQVFPFGRYRTRQYEVVFSGDVKFVMGDIEEDIEELL